MSQLTPPKGKLIQVLMKKEKALIDISQLWGKEKLLKLLFRILKGHKCYVSFKKNITPSKLKQIVKSNSSYYGSGELGCVAEIINRSFTWEKTQEGHRFWQNIYDKLLYYGYMPQTLTYTQFKRIFRNE